MSASASGEKSRPHTLVCFHDSGPVELSKNMTSEQVTLDPGAGFEPALTDSESVVLPLDDPGMLVSPRGIEPRPTG